jgi:hypothetical protein
MVVAGDVEMLSGTNLKALDELELSFIVGSRVTRAPGDLESHFRWNGDAFADGQIIDILTSRHGNTKVNNTALCVEPVWDPEQPLTSTGCAYTCRRKAASQARHAGSIPSHRLHDIAITTAPADRPAGRSPPAACPRPVAADPAPHRGSLLRSGEPPVAGP